MSKCTREVFFKFTAGFPAVTEGCGDNLFCSTELKDFLNGKGFVLTLSESPGPPCCLPNGL